MNQQQPMTNPSQFPTFQKMIQNSYKDVKEVKLTFRFLHIFIPGSQKLEYIFRPNQKLIQVKKRLDEQTKKNFIFYLRQSFIPALDTRIGDLALCYGRKQSQNKYQITLSASQNPYQYG